MSAIKNVNEEKGVGMESNVTITLDSQRELLEEIRKANDKFLMEVDKAFARQRMLFKKEKIQAEGKKEID
jgi:hypothetical protein